MFKKITIITVLMLTVYIDASDTESLKNSIKELNDQVQQITTELKQVRKCQAAFASYQVCLRPNIGWVQERRCPHRLSKMHKYCKEGK